MDVFFLLSKELRADGVEGITSKLVLSLHELEQIKLQTANGDSLF